MSEHHRPLFRYADLSKRYRRTSRTINGWKNEGILPPPDGTINGRDYWYPETIEANERERFSAKQSRTEIEPRASKEPKQLTA